MAFRPIRMMQHLLAAVSLLLLLTAGAEFCLRRSRPPASSRVCGQTCPDIQPLLMPSGTVHHELSRGVTRQLDIHGRPTLFRINPQGLRGNAVVSPRPTDTYRILVLGDDVIFGSEVAEEDTFSRRLQELLSAQSAVTIEVLNGGVPGDCPLLSWLRMEHHFGSLTPDLVILHFDMTDVADDAAYRSRLSLPNPDDDRLSSEEIRVASAGRPGTAVTDSVTAAQPAGARSKPQCPHPSLWLPVAERTSTAASLVQTLRGSAIGSLLLQQSRESLRETAGVSSDLACNISPVAWTMDQPPDLRIQVRHALQPVVALRKTLALTQTPLLVITSPCVRQVVAEDQNGILTPTSAVSSPGAFTSRLPFEVLSRFCEQQQIRFLDTSESFRQVQQKTALFDPDSGAMSRLGLALYARQVAAFLLKDPPRTWEL